MDVGVDQNAKYFKKGRKTVLIPEKDEEWTHSEESATPSLTIAIFSAERV